MRHENENTATDKSRREYRQKYQDKSMQKDNIKNSQFELLEVIVDEPETKIS